MNPLPWVTAHAPGALAPPASTEATARQPTSGVFRVAAGQVGGGRTARSPPEVPGDLHPLMIDMAQDVPLAHDLPCANVQHHFER